MKNIFSGLLSVMCLTFALGQNNTLSFDKELLYEQDSKNEQTSIAKEYPLKVSHYLSKNALLGNIYSVEEDYYRLSFLINEKKQLFNVYTESFDNRLKIRKPVYFNGIDELKDTQKPYKEQYLDKFVSIKNLNTQQNINGYTCNEYIITANVGDDVLEYKICVDEKNPLNNVGFLYPQSKLKGLLVRYEDEYSNNLVLKSVNNVAFKASFDEKSEIEEFRKKILSKKEAYEVMENNFEDFESEYKTNLDNRLDDPILNSDNYIDSDNQNIKTFFASLADLNSELIYDPEMEPRSDRNKGLKIAENTTNKFLKSIRKNKLISKEEFKELDVAFKKYFEAAKKFKLKQTPTPKSSVRNDISIEEAETAYAYEDEPVVYNSVYKDLNTDEVSLAVDDKMLKDLSKSTPNYCKELKSKLPNFSDNKLKNAVHNFTGQTCDLYLYNSGYVAMPETIDSMRKSFLDIINKLDKFSKQDKEKLTTFFNSLD